MSLIDWSRRVLPIYQHTQIHLKCLLYIFRCQICARTTYGMQFVSSNRCTCCFSFLKSCSKWKCITFLRLIAIALFMWIDLNMCTGTVMLVPKLLLLLRLMWCFFFHFFSSLFFPPVNVVIAIGKKAR